MIPTAFVAADSAGLAKRIAGLRSYLRSGGALGRDADSLQAVRLACTDGLLAYSRYSGGILPAPGVRGADSALVEAPSSARTKGILADVLLLPALIARNEGYPLRPPDNFGKVAEDRIATFGFDGSKPLEVSALPKSALIPIEIHVRPSGDAGLIPLGVAGAAVALTTAEALAVVAVVGVVAAAFCWVANRSLDTIDGWARTRTAADVNLTRQAKSYEAMIEVYHAHRAAEEKARQTLPFTAAELAIIEQARIDLGAGRADAAKMSEELAKPIASSTGSNILLLGLAALAAFVYVQKSKR